MTSETASLFLEQLKVVATSPYALIAYVVLVVVFAITTNKAIRIKAITQNLTALPESDRASLLQNEYGIRLKEGMSATHFLKAQRNTFVFYAFLAVVVTILVIAITALLRAQPTATDLKEEAVRTAINQISASIDKDFQAIKGPRAPDRDDEDAMAFESRIVLPDSVYDLVQIPNTADELPYFIATLYHGSDADMAYRIYNNFVSQVRQCAPGWLEHAGLLDANKPVTAYVSFVKGRKKIVVSLNRGSEKTDVVYVSTMFSKTSRGDAGNEQPGAISTNFFPRNDRPSMEELDLAHEEQQKEITALRSKGPPYGYRLTENCTVVWTNYRGWRIWVKNSQGITGGAACPVEPLGVQIPEDPTHYYDSGEIKSIASGEPIPNGCYPNVDGICAGDPERAKLGQTVKFKVWPYGGSGVYVYTWSDGGGHGSHTPEFLTSFTSPGLQSVKVAITSNGQTVYKECKVIVTND